MKTSKNNRKNENTIGENEPILKNTFSDNTSIPKDLIEDLKKGKIDPLTEGKTNLGYEERSPRKKELEEKKHYDKDDI
jgi:hypothetical protein